MALKSYLIAALWLLLAAHLPAIASAAEYNYTFIEDKWVKQDRSFSSKGYSFSAVWTEDSETAIVTVGDLGRISLSLLECKKAGPWEVCFQEYRKKSGSLIVPNDTLSKDLIIEMRFGLYAKIAHLNITRSAKKEVLQIGESTEIDVNVVNFGIAPAENIIYKDRFGSDWDVEVLSGDCSLDRDTVVWNGTLQKDANLQCRYRITPTDVTSLSSKASADYHNGLERQTANSDVIKLSSKERPIYFKTKLNNSRPELGDMILFNITVNYTDMNLAGNVSFKKLVFNVPDGLNVVERHKEINYDSIWPKWLPEEGKSLYMVLRSERTGESFINITAFYDIDGFSQALTETVRLTTGRDFGIDILMDAYSPEMALGKPNTLSFSIMNNHEWFVPQRVVATVSSNLTGFKEEKRSFETLGRKNRLEILLTTVTPEEAASYAVNITLSYESEYGEVFTQSLDLPVKARAGAQQTNADGDDGSGDDMGDIMHGDGENANSSIVINQETLRQRKDERIYIGELKINMDIVMIITAIIMLTAIGLIIYRDYRHTHM